jgi:hypothetical protein
MHWKDSVILTWGVASAVMFNANLAVYGLERVYKWFTQPSLCPECQRRAQTLNEIDLTAQHCQRIDACLRDK